MSADQAHVVDTVEKLQETDVVTDNAPSGMAVLHVQEFINRWSPDPERSLQIAGELADRALQLDRSEPHAHYCLTIVHTWQKQIDRAIADARRALALDPSFADAYAALGVALHYAGKATESLEQF